MNATTKAQAAPFHSARVLVLDGDMAPAVAVTRSLAQAGHHVIVGSAEERPIAGFSNGCHGVERYPDPLLFEMSFVDWVRCYFKEHAVDLVIPVTERSLVPLSRHRDQLNDVLVSMARQESLEIALDKSQTFEMASELGIKVPSGHFLSSIDDLDRLDGELNWPQVIKPVRSVSYDGSQYHKHSVSYADNRNSLDQQLRAILRSSPVVLQEHFSGVGVGVELIAKDGEIRYAFQHQRLHEVPLTGGGSSFRMSTELTESLLEASALLMKALQWHGVAMVEFKYQPDTGEYRLMEINGRLWGSLPLATAAGANFPAMMAELELLGDIRPWPPYKRGVYCRKLSRDVVWFEQVLRTRSGSTVSVPGMAQVLRDAALTLLPWHHFDLQSFSDPVPGLIDVHRMLKSYGQRLMGVLAEKWFTTEQRLAWRNGTVREKLQNADTVLVLCYGNINRSALAGFLLGSELGLAGKKLLSGGFHHESGRPMDPVMAGLAEQRGLSIREFRSTTVTATHIAQSDLILVMEKRHVDEVLRLCPEAQGRTFLLGCCLNKCEAPKAEIPDPYGKPTAAYERCYQAIETATSRLLQDLPRRP